MKLTFALDFDECLGSLYYNEHNFINSLWQNVTKDGKPYKYPPDIGLTNKAEFHPVDTAFREFCRPLFDEYNNFVQERKRENG